MLAPKCRYFLFDTRSTKRINKINKKYGIITLLNGYVCEFAVSKASKTEQGLRFSHRKWV